MRSEDNLQQMGLSYQEALGIEPRSSGLTASTFTYLSISLSPALLILIPWAILYF